MKHPLLGESHIDIPAPPGLNPRGAERDPSPVLSAIPALGVAAMAAFYVLRTGDPLLALPMIGVAVAAVGGTVLAANWRKRDRLRAAEEERLAYLRLLENIRARLHAARDAQIGMLMAAYPPITMLGERAFDESPPLRAALDDLPAVRVGMGRIPSAVTINTPAPEAGLPEDNAELLAALKIADEYRVLRDAPIIVPLGRLTIARDSNWRETETSAEKLTGITLGINGDRAAGLALIRAVVCQLAMTYSPEVLRLYMVTGGRRAADWTWLEWLPHASGNNAQIAFEADRARAVFGSVQEAAQLAARTNNTLHVVIVDGSALPVPDFSDTNGAVTTITLAGDDGILPAGVRGGDVISCGNDGSFLYQPSGSTPREGSRLEGLNAAESEQIARALCHRLADHAHTQIDETPARGFRLDENGIPTRVELLHLYGARRAEELAALMRSRWSRLVIDGALPFPVRIGMENGANALELLLDEAHHGPHGMLVGTTGSGKSELLTTLICSLALEHDPRLLNFLLIDFKGGSAFSVFADLPHTAGMVTNLDGAMVARTLAALKAETDWRQAFLKRMNARDITQYHRVYTRGSAINERGYQPLPHLFIIVDEFAQLAREMPDFLRELIRTAQIGRGLGLHLILGTQSPELITDEMNANLQFRACLRVQSADASRAILKRPDAAYIPANRAGRGYFQVGAGQRGVFKVFQTAFTGGDYQPDHVEAAPIPVEIRAVMPDGQTQALHVAQEKVQTHSSQTVAAVIAETIKRSAASMNIPRARAIFLPPPTTRLTLGGVFDQIGAGGWTGDGWRAPGRDEVGRPIPIGSAPIGIIDDAENRTQPPLWIRLHTGDTQKPDRKAAERSGHLLIVGAPGSGKTSALRTLAWSFALLHSPDVLHIYPVSFTGGGLDEIGRLPHAERVIYGSDVERVRRLMARMVGEITSPQQPPMSMKLILIDQYEGLRELLREREAMAADFERLIVEGRAAGISIAVTASSADAIPDRLRSLIPQRIALALGDPGGYYAIVGKLPVGGSTGGSWANAGIDVALPPGRGYWYHTPPLMCQIAGTSENVPYSDNTNVPLNADTADAMRAAYQAQSGNDHAPRPLRALPRVVMLEDLLASASDTDETITTVVGVRDDDALSAHISEWAGNAYLVVGTPGSGKTNLLTAAALSAAWTYPPDRFRLMLVDIEGELGKNGILGLEYLPHTALVVDTPDLFADACADLPAVIKALPKNGAVGIIIDNYDALADALRGSPEGFAALRDLLRAVAPVGLWAAGYFERTSDPLIKYLLMRRNGFAFGSKESAARLNARPYAANTPLGGVMHAGGTLPEGRAYVPQPNGTLDIVQTALVIDPAAWVDRVRARWDGDAVNVEQSAARDVVTVKRVNMPGLDEGATDIDVDGLIKDLLG